MGMQCSKTFENVLWLVEFAGDEVQSTADDGRFRTFKPSYIYQLCQMSSNPPSICLSWCMATGRGLTGCRGGEGVKKTCLNRKVVWTWLEMEGL